MDADIDSINHVGLVVHDLDAAAARYEAMGFLLSPLSMHKGAMKPDEPEVPYGTGNRCAIFPGNYLEIVAHVDPSRFDFMVRGFLARHEGAHIICFGCGDATTVDRRLAGAGIGTSGVIPLAHDVPTAEGTRTAKFDCVHIARGATPEGLIQAAHHRTPEYIHQARYLAHPNSVVALSDVFLATDDPAACAATYATLTGQVVTHEAAACVVTLPRVGRLTIGTPQTIDGLLASSVAPPAPCIAGFGMATTDLAGLVVRLRENAIPFERADGRVVVPASAAFGAAIAFAAA